MDHNIIVLEGCDRSAKTTIANHYKSLGYDVIHFSAPDKRYTQPGYTGPSYLDDMVKLCMTFVGKKIVLDRSPWGELVWPQIYDRKPLLDEEDIEILKEILDGLNTKYILMYDQNTEAHWKRCEENNEPLTRTQFYKAVALYDKMAQDYSFEKKQLQDFNLNAPKPEVKLAKTAPTAPTKLPVKQEVSSPSVLKLEKANAINTVLKGRIIKKTGGIYEELEKDIRTHLSNRLNALLGDQKEVSFTPDEVQILKIYCKRIVDKTNTPTNK